jgi:cytochrome c
MRLAAAICLAAFAAEAVLNTASAAALEDPAERAFQYCYSCHSVDPSDSGLPGPNLHGLIGRPVASLADFKYSPALKEFATSGARWTPELIERFIQDPGAMVPGTRMEPPLGADQPEVRRLVLEYISKQK